jgi:hypothetical protein
MRLPMTSDEYEGEFIIHSTTFEQGKRIEEREWIPRTIHNDSHTGHAVIIGNGLSRQLVDTHLLKTHMGGMKGERRAQLYGCNALYRDMSPDFLISTNPNMVEEIVESGYTDKNIVYTNAQQAVKYPGKFHLIPQNMPYNAGCIATYIACFDKHERIYLLGFDGQPELGMNNNIYADTENYNPMHAEVKDVKWLRNMEKLFSAYNEVDFIWVHPNPEYNFPDQWRWHKNVRFMTTKKFVGELSIGVMRNDV